MVGWNEKIVEWVGIHRDITDTRADALRLHQLAETIDAVFYVHEIDEQRIAYVSRAYEQIWGQSRDELYADARGFLKSVHPDDRGILDAAMRDQVAGKSMPIEYRLRLEDGTERVILDRPFDAIDPVSGARRIVGLASDITEFRQALDDKDLLAREIDHRVKNSLTVVGSLLSMQRSASTSPETRAALDEAAARVLAVARVHEGLHKNDQLGLIAFGEYLDQLCRDLSSSMRSSYVKMDCQTVPIDLPAEQAMPLALIANELITNAFKHGSAAGATNVSIELTIEGGILRLTVTDDGAGIPVASSDKSASLGLKIVKALARQLGAQTILPAPGTTAKFVILVPVSSR